MITKIERKSISTEKPSPSKTMEQKSNWPEDRKKETMPLPPTTPPHRRGVPDLLDELHVVPPGALNAGGEGVAALLEEASKEVRAGPQGLGHQLLDQDVLRGLQPPQELQQDDVPRPGDSGRTGSKGGGVHPGGTPRTTELAASHHSSPCGGVSSVERSTWRQSSCEEHLDFICVTGWCPACRTSTRSLSSETSLKGSNDVIFTVCHFIRASLHSLSSCLLSLPLPESPAQ